MEKQVTRTIRTNVAHVFETEVKEGVPSLTDKGMFEVEGMFRNDDLILKAIKKQNPDLKAPVITEVLRKEATYAMPESAFFANATLLEDGEVAQAQPTQEA